MFKLLLFQVNKNIVQKSPTQSVEFALGGKSQAGKHSQHDKEKQNVQSHFFL
jgi:hypothetical protein